MTTHATYYVKLGGTGWEVWSGLAHRVSEAIGRQIDAILRAKALARRDGHAKIVVHDEGGGVLSEFVYQRTETRTIFA